MIKKYSFFIVYTLVGFFFIGNYVVYAACINTGIIGQGCWPWGYDGHYDTEHNWCLNSGSIVQSVGWTCYWGSCAPNCAGGISGVYDPQDGYYHGYQCDTYCAGTCTDVCENIDGIQCNQPIPNACTRNECDICPSIEGCQTYGSCGGGNSSPTCSSISQSGPIYSGSPGNSIIFTANATDSDGTVTGYSWTQSSPNAILGVFYAVPPTTPITTANPTTWAIPLNATGTYGINCRVTDNGGATANCPKLLVPITPSFRIQVTTKYLSSGTDCKLTTSLPAVNVTIKNNAGNTIATGVTDSLGVYTSSTDLSKNIGNLTICVSKASYTTETTCTAASSDCMTLAPPASGSWLQQTFIMKRSNSFPTCTVTGPTILYSGIPPSAPYPFSVTASDPDGSIASYLWTALPLPGTFSSINTVSTGWTPPINANGAYTISNTVTDNMAASFTCNLSVNVSPGFNLNVYTYLKNATDSCGASTVGLEGATVTVYNDKGSKIGTGTTDKNGLVSFTNLNRDINRSLRICATPPTLSDCSSYLAVCPVGGCLDGITPVPAGTTTARLEIQEDLKDGWVTSIDGDVKAQNINAGLPCSGGADVSGGFTSSIINLSDDQKKGYLFSKTPVSFGTSSLIEKDKGGWAGNTAVLDPVLDSLTFKVPRADIGLVTDLTSLRVNYLRKIDISRFNTISAAGTVSYGLGGPGIAVLYIDGTNATSADQEVVISNPITQGVYFSDRNLVIVTDHPVRIKKNVGVNTKVTPFTLAMVPQIQASIISSRGIIVEAESTSGVSDIPIMIGGPLVSLESISFDRDLLTDNDSIPAQAVKYDPRVLYYLTKLERDNSQTTSYTGLAIYDVQWVYKD